MDANDSELTPELESAINQIEADLETKADSVMVLVQEAEHEAEAARLESNRLRSRAQACDHRAASLRKYLMDTLTSMGRHRIITPRFKGTIQLAQESIRWTFASDPPERFQRVTVDLDGTAARKALRDEGSLPEGFEVTRTRFLRIR